MLTHRAHYHHELFYFCNKIINSGLLFSICFEIPYLLIKPLLVEYQDWCQVWVFFLFMSTSNRNWCSIFLANMVNIIHSMQVLNMFNSCTDTTGPFVIPFITCSYPFITCSYKIVKASVGSRIFTQGSPHTHPCRRRSCLNCHKPNSWN